MESSRRMKSQQGVRKSCVVVLCIVGLVILSVGIYVWASFSPLVEDIRWINSRDNVSDLSMAFLVALKTNDPAAYEMIDPAMKDRLDEWMDTHKPVRCSQRANFIMTDTSAYLNDREPKVTRPMLACFAEENGKVYNYYIEVKELYIRDMRIIDWEGLSEERDFR